MNNPRQQYLFNYMEYDDYESDDYDNIQSEFELDSEIDELNDIVNDESDIVFYNQYLDEVVQWELSQPLASLVTR